MPRCSFAFRGGGGDFVPPTKKHSPKLAWGLLYYGYTHCDILCDNVVIGGGALGNILSSFVI